MEEREQMAERDEVEKRDTRPERKKRTRSCATTGEILEGKHGKGNDDGGDTRQGQ